MFNLRKFCSIGFFCICKASLLLCPSHELPAHTIILLTEVKKPALDTLLTGLSAGLQAPHDEPIDFLSVTYYKPTESHTRHV